MCLIFFQKKSNTSEVQEKCIVRLVLYHVCVNLPVMLVSYPTFRFMGLRSSLPLPHWYSIVPLKCFGKTFECLSSYLKLSFTSSWRISCSIGDTGYCIPNGYTSMFTVSITSKCNDFHRDPFMSSLSYQCFICRYATPFGLTSEYAHPAEILFLGFATVVGPALTGPHLFTLWLWMILRVLETVEAHSGYHFPWSPSNFLPLYGG
ncbi:hypothetical protein B296_00049984 [Ensete ventricosum]|uniref:Uncharacterized protein n=1 Tax=Ensete ventricosum TaxID=4639 RepID=A0A426YN74_ENSVE|nr:hypothetical protein B296_00049984 [Ensete ventricosum]